MKQALIKHRYKIFLVLCALMILADLYSTHLSTRAGAIELNAFFNHLLETLGDWAYPVGFITTYALVLVLYATYKIHRWLASYLQNHLPKQYPAFIEIIYTAIFTGIIATRILIVNHNLRLYFELTS